MGTLMATGVVPLTSKNGDEANSMMMLPLALIFLFLWIKFFYLPRKRSGKSKTNKSILVFVCLMAVFVIGIVKLFPTGEPTEKSDYVSSTQDKIRLELYPDADFTIIKDVLVWDNIGLTEVKNTFTIDNDDAEHNYHARYAGNDLVYLTVDGEVILSDMDKQMEYLDKLDAEKEKQQ